MHSTRLDSRNELLRLARDGQWYKLYRRHVLYEFPREARLGFQLAFLRPLCDPDMARILVGAGRITENAKTRAYDTGITIHEIIVDGFEGERAQRMIHHMNRQHRHFSGITDEQMTYVLACFVVLPQRHMERTGWREVLEVEVESSVRFYNEMGRRMGIRERPQNYPEACAIVDNYEKEHLRPSDDTLALGQATLQVISGRIPAFARPLVPQFFATQIGDEAASRALGLPAPSRPVQWLAAAMPHARRLVVPHTRAPRRPSFTPGQPSGPYRDGYVLEDIEKP